MKITLLLLYLGFSPASAFQRTRFQHWFPQYGHHWINAAEGPCRQRVQEYIDGNRTRCKSPCACAADCILQNITGTIQSNFASAQVVLGLVPVTLGLAGPTLTELAILSSRNPLLAVLLSIGSPAINVSKVFPTMNIIETVNAQPSGIGSSWVKMLDARSIAARTTISILMHSLALFAISLNIWTSVHTDMRTISGWRCGTPYLPLIWSTLAFFVHGCAVVAVRARIEKWSPSSLGSCLQSEDFRQLRANTEGIVSEATFWLASLCAVVHLVFGILVLASLMFISALEAIKIFALYATCAVVCKLILLLELEKLRYELRGITGPRTG